jgi:hypothetical protein
LQVEAVEVEPLVYLVKELTVEAVVEDLLDKMEHLQAETVLEKVELKLEHSCPTLAIMQAGDGLHQDN